MYEIVSCYPDVNTRGYRARLIADIREGIFPTRPGHLSQLQTILQRMTRYNRDCLKAELRELLPQTAYEVAVGKRAYFRAFDGLNLTLHESRTVIG